MRNFAVEINLFDMLKTRIFPLIALVSIFLLGACEHKATPAVEDLPADTADTVALDTLPADRAFYGQAGDFGMSTFVLISDHGDTVEVTRTADDGTEGIIYGDAQPGDRYYLLTTPDSQTLVTAINLTLLNRYLSDYNIVNGRLVLRPESGSDTVTIDDLDEEQLIYHDARGKRTVQVLD